MIVNKIQAELLRLQLHPVNLSVSTKEGGLVTLRGSLLQYWKVPSCLDGQWLLTQLQGFGDAAGPEAVMSGLVAVHGRENKGAAAIGTGAQLQLFDPDRVSATKKSAAAKGHR